MVLCILTTLLGNKCFVDRSSSLRGNANSKVSKTMDVAFAFAYVTVIYSEKAVVDTFPLLVPLR